MSDFIDGKPSANFWIVGGAALAWNLIGLLFFYSQTTMSPEALAGFNEAQQAFFASTPAWATAAFAVAVIGGVLGSLFLLLRKAWAVPVFVVSFVAFLANVVHGFVLNDSASLFGTVAVAIHSVIGVVSLFLIFYSRAAKARRWIA